MNKKEAAEILGKSPRTVAEYVSSGVGSGAQEGETTQRLTGIPRSILLGAIKTGKLKADDKKFGRGWRMKRADLDAYMAKV